MIKIIVATNQQRWNITPCLVNVITIAGLLIGAWVIAASIY